MTPKRYSVEGNSFWPVESSMLEVTGTIIGKSAPSVLRRKNNRVPECGPPKVCLARESRRAESTSLQNVASLNSAMVKNSAQLKYVTFSNVAEKKLTFFLKVAPNRV